MDLPIQGRNRHNSGVDFTQVKRQMWVEMKRAAQLRGSISAPCIETEVPISADTLSVGISTNAGIHLQGFHRPRSRDHRRGAGRESGIWEAIESARAGGDVHVLATREPDRTRRDVLRYLPFEARHWPTFTMSAFESPNFEGIDLDQLLALPDPELDDNPKPYLITRRWVPEKYAEWGVDDALESAGPRRAFPRHSSRQCISSSPMSRPASISKSRSKKNPLDFGGDVRARR